MICLTLTGRSMKENYILLEQNRELIDIAELRMDYLPMKELRDLEGIRNRMGMAAIATFRNEHDGGRFRGEEGFRRKILLDAVRAGFDYVDLEYGFDFPEVEAAVQDKGTAVIRSIHNFSGARVSTGIIKGMLSLPESEIPKIAVYPQSSKDVIGLLQLYSTFKNREKKIILGMGAYGFFSRILYRKLGSLLTYCSSAEASGAPGHISPVQLKDVYNLDLITPDTAVYGIIGNPVMHSRSPHLHNAGYRKYSMDAVYIPFPVDNPDQFMKFANTLPIEGFSVTVPYKKDVIRFLDKVDQSVIQADACNTVVCKDDGYEGWNTDIEGFFKPLEKRISLQDIKRIAIIGAGGAAGAVIRALKGLDAQIHIFNRTEEKARALSQKFCIQYDPLSNYEEIERCDLVVQTTNVGMHPLEDKTPLPGYRFRKEQIVYDLIYTPEETIFLKEAAAAGCRTINGLEMLLIQGKIQFKLFTGVDYPEN